MAAPLLPAFCHSYAAVQGFLNLDEEVQAVAALREAALEHRWSICWLAVTAPLKAILFVFLSALAPLLHLFGQTGLATDTEILGRHLFLEMRLVEKMFTHGEDLLSPLFNTYAFSARHVYLQPSIATQELQADPELFATVRNWERVDFYQPDGVCRGIATFFIALYLRTEHLFPQSAEQHFRAIASLLADGASAKPALFQALCYTDLLAGAMRREIENLDALENGVYEIWLPRHRVAYVKLSGEQSFLVDPSVGVIALHGDGPPVEGRVFQITPISFSSG